VECDRHRVEPGSLLPRGDVVQIVAVVGRALDGI
jgi:hypothetical protein